MSNFKSNVTRRTFLRGTAAVAASPLVGRQDKLVPLEGVAPLKVGLVGCGGRGTGAAMQALSAEEGTVVLTALADVFPDRIESSLASLSEALGEERQDRLQVEAENCFVGFDAYKQLIASDVDVVLLCTPPHFRPEQLEAAVAAGKHVFCEKPVAVDASGVRRVLIAAEKARENRTSLVSGLCWRYNDPHRELYKLVNDGALGEIRSIYSTYNAGPNGAHARQEGWSDMEFQIRNWFNFQWLSGDHITEQAVHSLDKMAWAMQDVSPLSVTAVGGRQARQGAESGNIYDHFSATFEYPNNVKGFHMSRQMVGCAFDNSDWVMGEDGVATISAWSGVYKIEGKNPWEYEGEGNDMYQQEHDELFASIRAGEPKNDGIWMSHSTMLAIMTRMSAYTGQPVTWEQAMASEDRMGPESYSLGWVGSRRVAIPGQTKFI
ncbi:MAG: myo-inositol 2-dehydrogenase/D-chiro-inositol 1-dehydrogenase [Planctomycetota bacterium]|jgi:myo-inositol 2-dehydrogenase/D-chiro-inositol 1-dehydrogenase